MYKYFVTSICLFFSLSLISETTLIILGSGTPNPNPERYGSSYAVVVDLSLIHISEPTRPY